jgi:hypothetical protein
VFMWQRVGILNHNELTIDIMNELMLISALCEVFNESKTQAYPWTRYAAGYQVRGSSTVVV